MSLSSPPPLASSLETTALLETTSSQASHRRHQIKFVDAQMVILVCVCVCVRVCVSVLRSACVCALACMIRHISHLKKQKQTLRKRKHSFKAISLHSRVPPEGHQDSVD